MLNLNFVTMFPQKVIFNSQPVLSQAPADETERNSFIVARCYSVDQTLSAPHNLLNGHIRNDLSTLLQPKDSSQYMAKLMELNMMSPSAGFDEKTPAEVIYRSIVPANCQTPSELQHFSQVFAKDMEKPFAKMLAKRQKVEKPADNKIEFKSDE